jgi:hypothetical protein
MSAARSAEGLPGELGQGAYMRMPQHGRHTCPLPAEWIEGAVWKCPAGHLWLMTRQPKLRNFVVVMLGVWEPAPWWLRLRHAGRRTHVAMGNENRVQPTPKRTPPKLKLPPLTLSGLSQREGGEQSG